MKNAKIIKSILVIVVFLELCMFFVPGMVSYTGVKEIEGRSYMLIQKLPEGSIASGAKLTFMLTLFTLIAAGAYQYSDSLIAIRLCMVFAAANTFFTASPLMADYMLVKFPYAILPIIVLIGFIISLVVMLKEQDAYYDRMANG